jgi:hypothetical protein
MLSGNWTYEQTEQYVDAAGVLNQRPPVPTQYETSC